MATAQNAFARKESPSQAAPQRALTPINGERNALAGRRGMEPERLAVFTSMVQRDPRANANRGNSELCMQDLLL